jgi:hypothetical protein
VNPNSHAKLGGKCAASAVETPMVDRHRVRRFTIRPQLEAVVDRGYRMADENKATEVRDGY